MSSTLSTVIELAYRTVHLVSPVDRRSDAIRRDPSPARGSVAAPRVVAGRACNSYQTRGIFARKRRQTELSYNSCILVVGTTVRTPGPGMNSSNPGGGHAMAIGSARSPHRPSGFYPRCSTFNDQAIQAHREVSQSVSCFRGRTHRRCAQRGNTVEASRRAARASARANDTARADVRADGAARARDPARADLARTRAGARTIAGARAGARADDAVARADRSPRSRSRRCNLRTWRRGRRRRRGRRSCIETRPLARPPKGTQKKSLDAAVVTRRRRRETTVSWRTAACQPPVARGSVANGT